MPPAWGPVPDAPGGIDRVAFAFREPLRAVPDIPRATSAKRIRTVGGYDPLAPGAYLEVIGLESADPRWIAQAADSLVEVTHRVRALGTMAVTLCQVAGARFDGMTTIKGCRAVDAAAGQLIVREAGGLVAFTGFADPLGAPLDLEPHSALVAARTERGLAELARVPRMPS